MQQILIPNFFEHRFVAVPKFFTFLNKAHSYAQIFHFFGHRSVAVLNSGRLLGIAQNC